MKHLVETLMVRFMVYLSICLFVDKLDLDKLVSVPVDLSKLRDVVKNGVVKKIVHDKLVAKLNNIDTSGLVIETKYDTGKLDLEKKISCISKKKFLILAILLEKNRL